MRMCSRFRLVGGGATTKCRRAYDQVNAIVTRGSDTSVFAGAEAVATRTRGPQRGQRHHCATTPGLAHILLARTGLARQTWNYSHAALRGR